MESKGVTTQMKALDGYFLMVFFTLLLNRVHVFAIFNLVSTETIGSERVKGTHWMYKGSLEHRKENRDK